jgi:hypothetical protein
MLSLNGPLLPSPPKFCFEPNDSTTCTLVKGTRLVRPCDSFTTVNSNDATLCKEPVVSSLVISDSELLPDKSKLHSYTSDGSNIEISISGTSLKNGSTRVHAELALKIPPHFEDIFTSKMESAQSFGSFRLIPRSCSSTGVPCLNVNSCFSVDSPSAASTVVQSRCAAAKTERFKAVTGTASKSKNRVFSSLTPVGSAALSVIGKGEPMPLPEIFHNIGCPSGVSDKSLDSPEVSCEMPTVQFSGSTPRVPAATPRLQSRTETSLNCTSHVGQNSNRINTNQISIPLCEIGTEDKGVSNSQTPPRTSLSRSKLLLQSPSCMHPTLMSSDEGRVSGNNDAIVQLDVHETSVASLPWFIKDGSSRSRNVHAAHGVFRFLPFVLCNILLRNVLCRAAIRYQCELFKSGVEKRPNQIPTIIEPCARAVGCSYLWTAHNRWPFAKGFGR